MIDSSAHCESLEPMSQKVQGQLNNVVGSAGTARVTLVKGAGFPVKRRWLRRNVVPDVYCCIKMASNDDVWRSTSIDSATPEWDESRHFAMFETIRPVIHVEAFDSSKDSSLGTGSIALDEVDGDIGTIELQLDGEDSGASVTIQWDKVEPYMETAEIMSE